MDTTNNLIAWSALSWKECPIFDEVHSQWNELLEDNSKTEHVYLKYLKDHADFFLHDYSYPSSLICISELQFGSDYRPDFTRCYDLASVGFQQEFIEIESPHDNVFTNKGNPSAQLTEAINQIENWRIWVDNNRELVKRIFPSVLFRTK